MCMACEANGIPAATTRIHSFATREEALAYGKRKEFEYIVKKLILTLDMFGVVDMYNGLDGYPYPH